VIALEKTTTRFTPRCWAEEVPYQAELVPTIELPVPSPFQISRVRDWLIARLAERAIESLKESSGHDQQ
jgi:hypothetical protein